MVSIPLAILGDSVRVSCCPSTPWLPVTKSPRAACSISLPLTGEIKNTTYAFHEETAGAR
jgi:hypothetical protein